jgi:hypothetical protein
MPKAQRLAFRYLLYLRYLAFGRLRNDKLVE